MENNVKIFLGVIGILIVGIVATIVLNLGGSGTVQPGIYDDFATCLKDRGAIFYGAFWCPHCQAQKKMFGTSASLLPYVECSTVNGSGQTQACIDKKVTSYPTWEFADGSRLNGEIPLAELAEKTGCALPSSDIAPAPVGAGASTTVE